MAGPLPSPGGSMVVRVGGNWAVTSGQGAGGAAEAKAIPGATKDTHQPDPKNRHPQEGHPSRQTDSLSPI